MTLSPTLYGINKNLGGTCGELRKAVSQLCGIPLQHLTLYKFLHFSGKWRVLSEEAEKEEKQTQLQLQQELSSATLPDSPNESTRFIAVRTLLSMIVLLEMRAMKKEKL
jgi:hypothetical protein